MSVQNRKHTGRLLLGVAVVAGVIGIYYSTDKAVAKQSPEPQATPAISVTVSTLAPKHVRIWSEYSGRLQAVDSAEIRPEVSGRITKINFKDGQYVKQDDTLFIIDPRPYEAAVAKAEAALASA